MNLVNHSQAATSMDGLAMPCVIGTKSKQVQLLSKEGRLLIRTRPLKSGLSAAGKTVSQTSRTQLSPGLEKA